MYFTHIFKFDFLKNEGSFSSLPLWEYRDALCNNRARNRWKKFEPRFLRISSHARNTIDPFTGGADLSFSFDLSPILKDVRPFNASSPIFSTTTTRGNQYGNLNWSISALWTIFLLYFLCLDEKSETDCACSQEASISLFHMMFRKMVKRCFVCISFYLVTDCTRRSMRSTILINIAPLTRIHSNPYPLFHDSKVTETFRRSLLYWYLHFNISLFECFLWTRVTDGTQTRRVERKSFKSIFINETFRQWRISMDIHAFWTCIILFQVDYNFLRSVRLKELCLGYCELKWELNNN